MRTAFVTVAWSLIVVQIVMAPVFIYGFRQDRPWFRRYGTAWLLTGWLGMMIFLALGFRRLVWLL